MTGTPASSPNSKPSSTTAAGGAQPAVDALQTALAAEHAAVFAYSVIGVHLQDAGQVQSARDLQQAHRSSRDALAAQVTAGGATPVVASATYAPAQPVHDAPSAQRWAVQIEQQCAAGYRYVLAASATAPATAPSTGQALAQKATAQKYRVTGLDGLVRSAENALLWRRLLTPDRPTEAFPGS
jgi:hypothetical protein